MDRNNLHSAHLTQIYKVFGDVKTDAKLLESVSVFIVQRVEKLDKKGAVFISVGIDLVGGIAYDVTHNILIGIVVDAIDLGDHFDSEAFGIGKTERADRFNIGTLSSADKNRTRKKREDRIFFPIPFFLRSWNRTFGYALPFRTT